jgi:prophage regulatory protein
MSALAVKKAESGVRKMLTAEEVLECVPFSRTTLFRLERDGLFPLGVAPAPHRKLWFEDEVIAWQKDLQDPNSELSLAIAARLKQPHSRKKRSDAAA